MKRKEVLVAGRKVEILSYDTPLAVPDGGSVKDLNRDLDGERELFVDLERRARDAASRMAGAGMDDRAVNYWEIGRTVNEVLARIEREVGPTGTRPFQVRERIEETFLDRLSQELKSVGSGKDEYSKPYLRKMARLARMMTREQVTRPVPYPFFHELLHDELSPADIDAFLQRCEQGEFGSSDNMRLRAAVNRCLIEKEINSLELPETEKSLVLDQASAGLPLKALRRHVHAIKNGLKSPTLVVGNLAPPGQRSKRRTA